MKSYRIHEGKLISCAPLLEGGNWQEILRKAGMERRVEWRCTTMVQEGMKTTSSIAIYVKVRKDGDCPSQFLVEVYLGNEINQIYADDFPELVCALNLLQPLFLIFSAAGRLVTE